MTDPQTAPSIVYPRRTLLEGHIYRRACETDVRHTWQAALAGPKQPQEEACPQSAATSTR